MVEDLKNFNMRKFTEARQGVEGRRYETAVFLREGKLSWIRSRARDWRGLAPDCRAGAGAIAQPRKARSPRSGDAPKFMGCMMFGR
jgi:hypothetical protein